MHMVVGYHAMDHWLPENEFEQHPEWFGMRDGERVRRAPVVIPECPHLDADLPIQPCYANEGLAEFLTDRMAAQVQAQDQGNEGRSNCGAEVSL